MCHVATGDALQVNPVKVKTIQDMLAPSDKAGMQRQLGLTQYLSKLLANLSHITKPLRGLTQQDTEWCWDDAQNIALTQLKKQLLTLQSSASTTSAMK